MYKVKNNLSPTLMKHVILEREIPYNLRNLNPFQSTNVSTVFNGTETVAFRGPKIWAIVPEDIKKTGSLTRFKEKIKNWEPNGCTCRLCKLWNRSNSTFSKKTDLPRPE